MNQNHRRVHHIRLIVKVVTTVVRLQRIVIATIRTRARQRRAQVRLATVIVQTPIVAQRRIMEIRLQQRPVALLLLQMVIVRQRAIINFSG